MVNECQENKLIAVIWFVLSFTIAVSTFYIWNTSGRFLIFTSLGMSIVLLLTGRQRVKKYRLENEKYNKFMGYLGIFIVFANPWFLHFESKL